jgi:hypothetical protein
MYKLRPFEYLYNKLQFSKHEVDLTYKQFLEFTKIETCHYCDCRIKWVPFNSHKGQAVNLDRKDSKMPYSESNCVVCCKRCNYGKNKLFTYQEWFSMTACFRRAKAVRDLCEGVETDKLKQLGKGWVDLVLISIQRGG